MWYAWLYLYKRAKVENDMQHDTENEQLLRERKITEFIYVYKLYISFNL